MRPNQKKRKKRPSIFYRPALKIMSCGLAEADVRAGVTKHLEPLRQSTDALVECQGEINQDLQRNLATKFWDDF